MPINYSEQVLIAIILRQWPNGEEVPRIRSPEVRGYQKGSFYLTLKAVKGTLLPLIWVIEPILRQPPQKSAS